MPQLTEYLHQFTYLRTDINRKRWTLATGFRAPHKPFLLLAVLDLFAQGTYKTNLIEVTPELGNLFARYWSILMPADRRGNLALPFFHLRSSGFWQLIPQPGKEELLESTRQVDTLNQLHQLALGAQIDQDLFDLLHIETMRNALRTSLIQTYFFPDYHAALLNQGTVNAQAFQYSQALIEQVQKRVQELPTANEQYQPAVRDQGFRRAVVRVYDHRCAFCGVRMLTADGHSAVDAAHIVPWSVSHNDDPRNGMALCRLCHWTFDEGMLGISPKYTVLLSLELRTTLNVPGHLMTLEHRPIIGPAEEAFWPDQDAFNWHRHHIYRAA